MRVAVARNEPAFPSPPRPSPHATVEYTVAWGEGSRGIQMGVSNRFGLVKNSNYYQPALHPRHLSQEYLGVLVGLGVPRPTLQTLGIRSRENGISRATRFPPINEDVLSAQGTGNR